MWIFHQKISKLPNWRITRLSTSAYSICYEYVPIINPLRSLNWPTQKKKFDRKNFFAKIVVRPLLIGCIFDALQVWKKNFWKFENFTKGLCRVKSTGSSRSTLGNVPSINRDKKHYIWWNRVGFFCIAWIVSKHTRNMSWRWRPRVKWLS